MTDLEAREMGLESVLRVDRRSSWRRARRRRVRCDVVSVHVALGPETRGW